MCARKAPTDVSGPPEKGAKLVKSGDPLVVGALVGVVLLGGSNGIAAKHLVSEIDPFWLGTLRFAIAGGIMTVIVFVSRLSLPRGRSFLGAVIYGALGFAATFGFFFLGLRDAPASTAAIFLALVPLLTLGLAVLHRQERFRLQGLVGSVFSLGGVALIFADQLSASVPLTSLILIALGALSMAETGIVVKLIPRSDPRATNAVAMLTASALLLILSLVANESWTLPSQPTTWLAFVYLATFGSVVLFALFVYALERWTASAVAYSDLLIPLVTIALAALITGERLTPTFLIGGAVVMAGVFIGAFLSIPASKRASSVLPECIPVDAKTVTSAEPAVSPP